MNYYKALALALTLSIAVLAEVDTNSQHFYMFTYFINQYDQDGARIALSTDGINWKKINNEKPIFVPKVSNEHLMRDPNVYFDKTTGVFHLVWTTGWMQKNIGYATSKNLIDWGTQISIPVGEKIDNCRSCWAPELFYDDITDSVMLYWSAEAGNGYRGYYSKTKDFKEFTTPTKYFDPGYSIIDETIFKDSNGKYLLFFKDERLAMDAGELSKNIHFVTGPTPQGPWNCISKAVTNIGCEGPTMIKTGNEYRLYFDPYIDFFSTYRMVATTDLFSSTFPWTQGSVLKTTTGNFSFSHGSISEIPRENFLKLLYYISDNTPIPNGDSSGTTSPIAISDHSTDKQAHGCGAGFGLAFFPPVLFKAWSARSRKKKNKSTTKLTCN